MIYASIQSDLNLVLGLFAGCIGLVFGVVMVIGLATSRHMKNDYDQKGRAKGLAKKAGTTMLTALLKRLFIGRWH